MKRHIRILTRYHNVFCGDGMWPHRLTLWATYKRAAAYTTFSYMTGMALGNGNHFLVRILCACCMNNEYALAARRGSSPLFIVHS